MAASSQQPPVPLHPPPWSLHCEQYWLFSWLPAGGLPKGCYGRFEAPNAAAPGIEASRGGLVVIMLVRYTDTPCGPYDELMIIPGKFARPFEKINRRSITACYVSNEDTLYNGRLNWNVPKHLARFEWSSPPAQPGTRSSQPQPQALSVAVYPPDPSCTTPFFAAALRPLKLLPAISYASSFSPIDVTLIQPPLSALSEEGIATSGMSTQRAEKTVIATERWVKYRVPVISSSMKIMSVDSHTASAGDDTAQAVDSSDEWWPSSVRPWSIGCWLENAELLCEAGETWEA